MTFPAFKAGDPVLCGPDGGFDSHTLPPKSSQFKGQLASTTTRLAATALVMALCGTLAVLFSTTVLGVRLGAGVAGLGLAPVYPIFIAWLGQRFGAEAPRPGGVMFALASCGGATLPWLVGVVSTSFESLTAGLTVPLIGCLLMLVTLPIVGSLGGARAASAGAGLR